MKIKSLIKHNLMRAAMTLALVLTCATAWAQTTQSVTYIDADGNTQTVTATVLTGSESDLYAGWYVVNSDITYTSRVSLFGDMNLILVDGKTMSIGTADSPISSANAIDGSSYTLTIYGQSGQTGKLCAYNNSSSYDAVVLEHFNQHGGIVIINSNTDALSVYGNLQLTQGSLNVISSGASKNAIYISNTLSISGGTLIANAGYGIVGAVNFTGGNLTAIGTYRGISGNTNLSWTSTTNTFKCSRYGGNVTIAEGKTFYDGATPYSGTLNSSQKDAIAGKTLRPYSSNDFSVNDEGTEYTIYSAIGWDMFCDMLDEFDHSTNGGYCFDGKTVKLGANISITRAAGNTGYHDFNGTFDGQEYTLNVDITDTGEQGTAPFRFISNATIRNLHVTGTVTGTTHAAGLVGKACAGTMLIENCLVETNVNSTVGSNRHCGGIVGHGFGNNQNPNNVNLTLRNCVYAGTITCDNNYIGGLQGWSDGNTLTLENCLFAGNYQGTATGTAAFHPIALHNTGKTTNLTATNVFTAVAPTATNANFIAADGIKTTGRTTAPDNLGSQEASYSFMDMTVYENGLYYDGLYYVAPTLSTDNSGAYLINNEDDWTNFCDALYNNGTWNRFSGQTVKLGADISVSRMAGYDNHDFLGTFDGNHDTLTFTATATASYLAPFRNVLGNSTTDRAVIRDLNVVTNITAHDERHMAGLIALVWGYVDVTNCNVTVDITSTKGSTNTDLYPAGIASQVVKDAQISVSGCTVDGTISTDGKYAGGIIGIAQGSASITNSLSSVTINSSTEGDGTHGGLVGVQGNYEGKTITIEGCVFNGSLLGTATHSCGGFLGWRSQTVTINNSLFDPVQVTINTTDGSTPCATFVRNGDSSTTITDCYYTDAFGTVQGTKVYSISKGEYVTTLEINGTATQSYDVSGLSFYSTGIKCGDVLYAAANDVVSLILGCTPPAGFTCTGYTATSGNLNGTTLTMPHENVTINVTLEALPAVSYLDASGNTQQCTAYTLLDGTETSLGTADQETWYVADGTINFNQTINVNGVVHLILKDNAVMNVGTEQNPISDSGISAEGPSISIYGQSTGSDIGMLSVYATYCGIYDYDYYGNNNNPNYDYAVTINGGNIFVSASSYGIQSNKVTINGGQVWATAGISGIASYPNAITLGWTSPYDLIYADAYQGDVIVKSGKAFINNDYPSNNVVTGTVSDYSLINGMSLYPAVAVTLNDGINAGSGFISSGENLYAKAAVDVTVDASSVIAPPGYAVSGITVTPTVTVTDNGNGTYSFTTPAADVTVSATFALQPVSVNYLDENGVQHTVDALPLLGGDATTLAAGWYVVNSDISYTGTVSLVGSGDVKLILADDHTMNVGTSENRIEYGIKTYNNDQTLTIYGQSTGNHMGILSIYTSHYCIYPLALTINGGHVIANADGNYATALRTTYQTITINGGTVEATATGTGAYAIHSGDNFTYAGGTLITNAASENAIKAYHGRYTFTWRNPNDSITIGSTGLYAPDNTYTAPFTKAFTDGTNIYSGTLRGSQLNALAGKTLYPYSDDAIPYLNENGHQRYCVAYTTLTGSENSLGTANQETWYVADGNVSYTSTINVAGDVHLILKDNAVMNVGTQSTITYGIGDGSSTASISIYGQSTGNSKGQLHVNASAFGIFAKDGNLTINGGEVVVTSSGTNGLGIFANGGNITINGGNVEATSSGSGSIGIYTMDGGNVVINGGEVVVTSSDGLGIYANGGNITINGGNVEATSSGSDSSGIYTMGGGNVVINGGEVVATSSADRGSGIYASGGNVIINGGEVEATGSENGGEGIIVLKSGSNGGSISISNATVTASGSIGIHAQSGITINSGTVTTNNCNYGIYASSCSLTINGGQVTANGSTYGIWSEGDLTLGWTNASDYIHANSYLAGGTLSIAEGKAFIDEDGIVHTSGTVNASAINGKWLYPSVASIYTKGIEAHGTDESPSGWYLIASPLAGETNAEAVAHLINTTNPENFDLYRFDPSNEGSEWVNYKADNFSLVNGHGYLYASNDTKVLCFAGSFITDTESVAVGLAYDASDDHKCWNLVGNPFPCEATINKPYYMLNADGATINPVAISGDTPIPACTAVFVKGESGDDRVVFSKVSAPASSAPIGAINGLFSVSADKQVYFSQGNLQYQPSTATWRFAPNQYDLLVKPEDLNLYLEAVGNYADVTSLYTENYTDWIDFFGWGTSGWNSGANAYMPYDPSYMYDDFYPGGDYNNDLTGTCANADWAWYNPISNGGNAANQWRTLTHDEWAYLFSRRDGATSKYGHGSVNGVNGMIILPDNWTLPDGCSFTPGNSDWTNSYTTTEWAAMEAAGAVFLPAAGQRSFGTFVNNVGNLGRYWSSTHRNNTAAYDVWFHSDFISELDTQAYSNRSMGYSVRPVQDAQ